MCLHKRFITNKYTGKKIFVKCGKCSACLTEKMLHQRCLMVNEYSGCALFVTLTYSPKYVPYVFGEDCFADSFSVFRDGQFVINLPHEIYESLVIPPDNFNILFYDDLQKFVKRLQMSCKRSSLLFPKYSYVGEYGTRNLRPHFHILFYIEDFSQLERFENTLMSTWQFCDWDKLPLAECFKVVPTKSVSHYISTYITLSSCLPDYYNFKCISPKVRHSKNFGFNVPEFAFDFFWNNAQKGCVGYIVKDASKTSLYSFVLYPKYVVSRYFPKFKGFSRLTYDEVLCLVEQFLTHSFFPSNMIERLEYDENDLYLFRLTCRKFVKYSKLAGVPVFEYLRVLYRYYTILDCKLIRSVHFDDLGNSLPVSHLAECYDNLFTNLNCLYNGLVKNPNFYKKNLESHGHLLTYYKKQKHNHIIKHFINQY